MTAIAIRDDGEHVKRCKCCERVLIVEEFKSLRSRICSICKIVKQRWNGIVKRVEYGNQRRSPYESYYGVELRLTFSEFLAWGRVAIDWFMRRNPDQTPSIDRTGQHYEKRGLRVVSQPQNSGKRWLNCFTPEEAARIRLEWASGKYRFYSELARKYKTSVQTIGRLIDGITYRW